MYISDIDLNTYNRHVLLFGTPIYLISEAVDNLYQVSTQLINVYLTLQFYIPVLSQLDLPSLPRIMRTAIHFRRPLGTLCVSAAIIFRCRVQSVITLLSQSTPCAVSTLWKRDHTGTSITHFLIGWIDLIGMSAREKLVGGEGHWIFSDTNRLPSFFQAYHFIFYNLWFLYFYNSLRYFAETQVENISFIEFVIVITLIGFYVSLCPIVIQENIRKLLM